MDSTSDERHAIISDRGQILRATATEAAYVRTLTSREAHQITADRYSIYWLEWLDLAAAGLGPDRWQRYSTQRPPHIPQEPRDAGAVRRNWAALGVTA